MEAISSDEITDSSRHGWYSRYLRDDRGCDYQPERFISVNVVKKDGSYNFRFGYSHMASGLVCGFSCVVIISFISGSRIRHRYRGRCGNSFQCPAREAIRWTYIDSYLR